jgi:Glycosyltransferases involved in cell wall biogenesis
MISPLVSIIVPCYNQAQYLPETLDSVLSQTYPNWECIIVNDGSPDNTEEIAKKYCNRDSRFKSVYKENGGLSSARNVGIKVSSGEFILPLDSDDLISSVYLEKAVEQFQKFPETKLVYCRAYKFGKVSGEWNLPPYCFVNLLFGNMIFCSAFYRKNDYYKTNGYNEELKYGYEDWDFWISLLDKLDSVYVIPEFYFFYRIRENSMLNTMTDEMIYSAKSEIYFNHIDKYKEHVPYLIWNNPHEINQQNIIAKLENELTLIRNSKAYRFGKILLKPFSYLRNRVK